MESYCLVSTEFILRIMKNWGRDKDDGYITLWIYLMVLDYTLTNYSNDTLYIYHNKNDTFQRFNFRW